MTIQDSGSVLKPEQIDRDAAADLGANLRWSREVQSDVRRGLYDYWPSVQAFAAHRLATTPPPSPDAAEIVALEGDDVEITQADRLSTGQVFEALDSGTMTPPNLHRIFAAHRRATLQSPAPQPPSQQRERTDQIVERAQCTLCGQTWKRSNSQFRDPTPFGCAAAGVDRHQWIDLDRQKGDEG